MGREDGDAGREGGVNGAIEERRDREGVKRARGGLEAEGVDEKGGYRDEKGG